MTDNVEITKTYITAKGTTVTVTGTLELARSTWADGDTSVLDACEISIDVTVNGKSQGGIIRTLTSIERKQVPAEYTHRVGQLVVTNEQLAVIDSVRAELEQHPTWQEKQSRSAQNKSDAAEYRKTQAWIDRQS